MTGSRALYINEKVFQDWQEEIDEKGNQAKR